MGTFRGGAAKRSFSIKLAPSMLALDKRKETGGKPLLDEINRAIRAITVECCSTPLERRRQALEFLGRGRRTQAVAHTLSDALRRFGHLLTDKEKIKIAELLSENDAMSDITRDYVRCSLESAIQREVSFEVGEALRKLHQKISG